MIRITDRKRRAPVGLVIAAAMLPCGCAQLIELNPFIDDAPPSGAVQTASTQRLAEIAPEESEPNDRGWPAMTYEAQDDQVRHWPLWWEDFMENSGSGDDRFAWTWEDYFAFGWCPARFAVNTVGLPASAIVDPPWAVRCSDGRISPQTFGMSLHDASACE